MRTFRIRHYMENGLAWWEVFDKVSGNVWASVRTKSAAKDAKAYLESKGY